MGSFMPPRPIPTTLEIPDELLSEEWDAAMRGLEQRLAPFAGERPRTPGRHDVDASGRTRL
jgi:hypothetical protein